jgi:hypothetical protein
VGTTCCAVGVPVNTTVSHLTALALDMATAEANWGSGGTELAFPIVPAGPASPVGTYRLDLARTLDAEGVSKASPETRAAIEERMGPDAYLLEIREDGTFQMTIRLAAEPTVARGEEGLVVTTHEMDGEPAPSDGSESSLLGQEPGYLVVTEGGRRIYLRRS